MNVDSTKKKISNETEKYKTLQNAFLTIYENEVEEGRKRIEVYEEISKLEEVDNTYLKEIYNEFYRKMKELENDRDKYLDVMKNLILPVAKYYPEKLKETQQKLVNLSKLKKENEKNLKELNKARDKNERDKVQNLNEEIAKKNNEEKKEGETIEKEICEFEAERLNDNKCLFLQYILSELNYHARSLENTSNLFNSINSIDPRLELGNFIEQYGIKNGMNTLKRNGIDLEKLNVEHEKFKEIEKENRVKFYDDLNQSKNTKLTGEN